MYEYRASNIRVIDGDTVEADLDLGFGVTVRHILRLAGIDAPERDQESTEYLREFLTQGYRVVAKTEKDRRGKYGRYIAWLFVDDLSANDWMVRSGHATRWGTE